MFSEIQVPAWRQATGMHQELVPLLRGHEAEMSMPLPGRVALVQGGWVTGITLVAKRYMGPLSTLEPEAHMRNTTEGILSAPHILFLCLGGNGDMLLRFVSGWL